jgi:hypothetical protein
MELEKNIVAFIFTSFDLSLSRDKMSNSDDILEGFKHDVMKALQDNLVCLLHHGSRAKGEARPDSEYDVVIIAKQVDTQVIEILKDTFSKHPQFSFLSSQP